MKQLISDLVRKLASRKFYLQSFLNQNAPEFIINKQRRAISEAEAELEQAEQSIEDKHTLEIFKKSVELDFYKAEFERFSRAREKTDCSGCRFQYETPEGRKLTDEEIEARNYTCTRNNSPDTCLDFEDYGITNWESVNRYSLYKIKLAREMVARTTRELSDLVGEEK